MTTEHWWILAQIVATFLANFMSVLIAPILAAKVAARTGVSTQPTSKPIRLPRWLARALDSRWRIPSAVIAFNLYSLISALRSPQITKPMLVEVALATSGIFFATSIIGFVWLADTFLKGFSEVCETATRTIEVCKELQQNQTETIGVVNGILSRLNAPSADDQNSTKWQVLWAALKNTFLSPGEG